MRAKDILTLIQGLLLASASCVAFGIDYSEPVPEQCLEVKDIKPERGDFPPKVKMDSLHSCNAMEIYYDTLDMKKPNNTDWVKVVHCAHASNDSSILMMLYANGFGVKRNLRLAMRYACETDSAPAELEGRVEHLKRLMSDGQTSKRGRRFDLCDDVTSGMMQGICTSIEEARAGKIRNAKLEILTSQFSSNQKAGFAHLQTQMEKFAAARGGNETDMSGTAREAMAIESASAERDLLLNDIKDFEGGRLPNYTDQQFKSYDKRLNEIYRLVMRVQFRDGESGFGGTTIDKDSVKTTQKLWLEYRDAFVSFGELRYPSVKADSWKALLTKRRIAQLEEIYGYSTNE